MKKDAFLVAFILIVPLMIIYLFFIPSDHSVEEPTIDISTEKHNREWPLFSLSATLPAPSYYDEYEIITNNDKLFWAKFDGMPFDEFGDYIEECKKAGYTEHSYYVGDHLYYGETPDGRCVQLTFNTYTNQLVVQVAADAKDPDKWRG